MTYRFSLGLLPVALAIAAPLHAAPPASAEAAASSVTYHIERHNQQVTVKDANGKMLTTFSAATPTLQGLFIWSAAGPATDAPRTLALTLKDQNGKRIWSTPISVVYPQTVNVNYNSTAGGTLLVIDTFQGDASNPDYPPASGLTFTLGADGRPVSFGDASHQFRYVYEANGFSVVDKDGKILLHTDSNAGKVALHGLDGSGYSLHFNQDGTGTMQINGQTIPIDKATKDGKTYQSFPWNGHTVQVEQGCTWNVTGDGDLTVNAPSIAKTTASK